MQTTFSPCIHQVKRPPGFTAGQNRAVEPLGELIRRLRTERRLTQTDLAEAVGVDPATIARTEQGRGKLQRRNARSILDRLAEKRHLTEREVADFANQTGIYAVDDEGLLSTHDLMTEIRRGTIAAPARPTDPSGSAPAPDQLADLVNGAVARFGREYVIQYLQALASISPPAPNAPAREIRAVPASRPGYPDAGERKYEAAPPAASRARPKR